MDDCKMRLKGLCAVGLNSQGCGYELVNENIDTMVGGGTINYGKRQINYTKQNLQTVDNQDEGRMLMGDALRIDNIPLEDPLGVEIECYYE